MDISKSEKTITNPQEQVILMCRQFLTSYLLDPVKDEEVKSEMIKRLFKLTPDIKSVSILVEVDGKKYPQTYALKYRRSDYPQLYIWRKRVLSRDSYACKRCGSTRNLHVHHIDRWVDALPKRFDVDNGVTLCVKCHKLVHKNHLSF
jgi:hypothetical protein